MVQNYKRITFSKTKKPYVFFFVLSDEDIWPLARQQVKEQAPVQNYKRIIFSKTKKKYVFFFVFSDEDIWPLARQQVQEQAPVEQVVSVLVLVETGHPSP